MGDPAKYGWGGIQSVTAIGSLTPHDNCAVALQKLDELLLVAFVLGVEHIAFGERCSPGQQAMG